MRRGVQLLRDQNALFFDGLIKIALAEGEARTGDVDRALAILDEALATSDRIGHRAFDAELHRMRGEMLLQRDPANAAPAEEAYLAAIAVARSRGARSFELRAALSLAKLYQSTARPVEAHDVLAPALEGFAPTPEMPEIAEAQTLLVELAETDGVKSAAASTTQAEIADRLRQSGHVVARLRRRGNQGAFARAEELSAGAKNRGTVAAYYGQCVGSFMRGSAAARARRKPSCAWQDSRAICRSLWPPAAVGLHPDAGDTVEAGKPSRKALANYKPGETTNAQERYGMNRSFRNCLPRTRTLASRRGCAGA